MPLQLDKALERLARDPSAPIDLAEIALLMSRDEYPNLDVEAHLNELNAMAHEAQPYLRGHLAHQVQGLCRYVFHEMGFRGNVEQYYDPRNSYLNAVLERRLGIPITLAAVTSRSVGGGACNSWVSVCRGTSSSRRSIRVGDLLDPFNGGRVLSLGCESLVSGDRVPFEASKVAARAVALGAWCRMFNRLRGIYFKARTGLARFASWNACGYGRRASLRRDLGASLQARTAGQGDRTPASLSGVATEADDVEKIRVAEHGDQDGCSGINPR